MKGILKLRFAITLLFFFILGTTCMSYLLPDYTDEYLDAYDELSYDEQVAVDKWINNLPEEDESGLYLIGIFQYLLLIGLGFLTYKVWNVEKIE